MKKLVFGIFGAIVALATAAIPMTASAAMQIDSQLLGRKSLEVCNGGWMTPDGSRGSFTCRTWELNMQFGQIYPAYQGYPELALYFGNVVNSCGSGSAVELYIEATRPEVAEIRVRLDVCDVPPINGIPQVYLILSGNLYATHRQHLYGVTTSIMYDNRKLDGHPKNIGMYVGFVDITPK